MVPDIIKELVSRPVTWEEIDCGEDDFAHYADPATFEAWELKCLCDMKFPPGDIATTINAIKQCLKAALPSIEIGSFDDHWKVVYEKYGFLHLQMPITIEGNSYYIEIFAQDPHGARKCDDATISNTPHILGNKHFYM